MHRLFRLALFVLAGAFLPGQLMRRGIASWTDPDHPAALELATALDAQLRQPLEASHFGTGSAHFDGEWWLATHAFAIAGFAQVAEQHPETRQLQAARARHALDELMRPEVRAFDTALWGDDMLSCLDQDRHDHVVLGYLGVGMGAARLLLPDMPEAALHDKIVASLSRRLAGDPDALLATFPGVGFPVDNAAAFATLGLHSRATGSPMDAGARGALARWEAAWVDPDGLLVQTADPRTGRRTSKARGSGTTLAAWLLAPADPRLARRLATGVRRELHREVLGFGGIREYRVGEEGRADLDSGPVLLGVSVSATGFGLGASALLDDREARSDLWATTRTFGIPTGSEGFLTGGPLGNALLLAFLTTPPLPSEAT